MKLINQVKPEVLDALKKSTVKYKASWSCILVDLNTVKAYRDLTLRQIDQILLFLPKELRPTSRTDFYFGDYLLKKEDQS